MMMRMMMPSASRAMISTKGTSQATIWGEEETQSAEGEGGGEGVKGRRGRKWKKEGEEMRSRETRWQKGRRKRSTRRLSNIHCNHARATDANAP